MLTTALPCQHSLEKRESRLSSLGEPCSGSFHCAGLRPIKIFLRKPSQPCKQPCLKHKKPSSRPHYLGILLAGGLIFLGGLSSLRWLLRGWPGLC